MNTECNHSFKWYGYDTSKCEKCGIVLSDEEADELTELQNEKSEVSQ
jgi:hypothetical protein